MTRLYATAARTLQDCRGATAIEFAFILPVFAMMLIGTISAAQLGGAVSGMHFAVEEAARCSAVKKTVCASNAATITFAQDRYFGPGEKPTFVASSTGCGHTVTASANFELWLAFMKLDVPLSAAACYPGA